MALMERPILDGLVRFDIFGIFSKQTDAWLRRAVLPL